MISVQEFFLFRLYNIAFKKGCSFTSFSKYMHQILYITFVGGRIRRPRDLKYSCNPTNNCLLFNVLYDKTSIVWYYEQRFSSPLFLPFTSFVTMMCTVHRKLHMVLHNNQIRRMFHCNSTRGSNITILFYLLRLNTNS